MGHSKAEQSTSVTTNGAHTRLDVKPAKKTPARRTEEVFDIEVRTVAVSMTGTSPLLVNCFNAKGIQQMEDERALDAEGKRALKGAPKPPVIPEERWGLARIVDREGRDCIEAAKLKAALVTASKYKEIGIPSTTMRGAVRVLGDLIPIEHRGIHPKGDTLPDFWSDAGQATGEPGTWTVVKRYVPNVPKAGLPRMQRDVVRVGSFPNKKPDLRYRPIFLEWSITVAIEYEPALISLAGLHQLVRRAGRSVGLYEFRPEKSPAGVYGCFDLTEIVKGRKS